VPDPHQPFDELAVGSTLSALEPDDEARFTAHLAAGCARCERALAEHRETLGQLACAAPQVEPPPALLEGIRAGVRAAHPADPVVPSARTAPVPLADRRTRRAAQQSVQLRRSHLLTGAAAAIALVLGLGGWNAVLQRDNAEQGARVESLAAAVQALEDEDTRTVRLASPEGEVLAVAVVQGEQMSLVLDGLQPNDEDSVYVLWGQSRYGDVRAVGTFDIESDDLEVRHGMRLESGVGELTALMVTREQGRTPPAMTTQPVLVSGSVRPA
jgi:hypothetical protein